MDVTPVTPTHWQRIKSYGTGVFQINDDRYHASVAVTPLEVYAWNGVSRCDDITRETVAQLPDVVKQADILLLGSGKSYAPLPRMSERAFALAGMSPEVMDVGAACRTYNVLLSEERNVAALLIKIQ